MNPSVQSSGPMRGEVARRRRGAILSLELLFVLPLAMTILLALIEFSLLWTTQQLLQGAAVSGCRVATYPGATTADVREAVEQALSRPGLARACRLEIRGGDWSGDLVSVSLELPMSVATPDLLKMFGYSIAGRQLSADCVMRRE